MGVLLYMFNEDNEVFKNKDSVSMSAASSANPLSPDLVTQEPVAHPWRSSTVAGTKWIEFDFGSAITVDFCMIAGHNMQGGGGTLKVYGGSSSAPTTEIFDLASNVNHSSSVYGYRTAGSVSHRYWRIEESNVPKDDSFLEIGYVMLGVATQLGIGYEPGWNEDVIKENRQAVTGGGAVLVGELVRDYSEFSLTFGALNTSERPTFQNWVRRMQGSRKPLALVPNSTDSLCMFGRANSPRMTLIHERKATASNQEIRFSEEPRGVRINVA